MLSAAGAFDGGTFRTFECDERYLEYPEFNQGDAMVFVSHKYHGVAPVTRGIRKVCVVEYWTGEERVCPHRCKRRSGVCTYQRKAAGDVSGAGEDDA